MIFLYQLHLKDAKIFRFTLLYSNTIVQCNFTFYLYTSLYMYLKMCTVYIGRTGKFYNFSTGNPITGFVSVANARSSSISSVLSIHPSAPPNSFACSAFLAPGIGITFSWAMSQFRATCRGHSIY